MPNKPSCFPSARNSPSSRLCPIIRLAANEFGSSAKKRDENLTRALKKRRKVKNYLAIVKAKNLSDYASEYRYDEVRALATDEKTRQTVEGYITANRNAQKERERERRRWRREENGGLVNMGLQFLDFGWNGKGSGENIICYDLGLYLRFGNFADRVQFSVGLEPGLVAYNEDYIYSYTEDTCWLN